MHFVNTLGAVDSPNGKVLNSKVAHLREEQNFAVVASDRDVEVCIGQVDD